MINILGPLHDNEVLEELSDNLLLIFDLPTSNADEKFIGAELKILTLLDININNEIGVKRILKISVYDDTTKKLLHFQEAQIHHRNNTWVTFDVTAPVNEVLQTDAKTKYLKIVLTISAYLPNISNNLKLSLMPVEEDYEHDYPVLLLSYSSTKDIENKSKRDLSNSLEIGENRKKRSLEDDYEEETNRLWDDEFSNKKTQIKKAYQCQGRCFYPVADHLNPTKHAIVQALLHSVAPSRVSRSCCVPTILDSISILYVDNKGVLTYRYAYKDMVVVECGCR
ncbi:hypothetical protein NQ314_010352 [Rhamnusium bicolor]|uniref:TGF-beta family profile domain-containing protein n=1 Tax=Rhamnusium bicolor TaxID=1586634 RepID=A0AAV8XSL7_9CUCU|nr:hypothetical protein NQ314_010352 [Rhamnusium bicolor]